MDLKNKSISGALWTFLDLLVNKGTYFIASFILGGLLGPKEFGLLGMILVFISIGNTLIDSGLSTSLIRTENITESDYATVFVTNILMSIMIYLILFFVSPLIATFYNQPILNEVIRVYCLGFIFTSLRSTHNVKLIKELRFKELTLLNLPGNIVSIFISIWMAYYGFGIWSLVYLFLVNQFISTVVFWIFTGWRPLFDFKFSNYKKHFNFGYKLLLSAQLNIIFENIYNILIGKFFSVKTLGFYERAYSLNNYPVSILSGIVLKVTLPTLTYLKNDPIKIQSAYKNIMQMTFFILAACLTFVSLFASELVLIVLGKEWLPMVPLFQILTLSYIFYPIHSLNINILSVFGRSDLFLKLEILKKIIILIVVAISFKFGIFGLVWSNVINSILALFINTHYSGQFLNYSTKKQLIDLLPSVLVILSTLTIVYFFKMTIDSFHIIFQILFSFTVGLVSLVFISEKSKLAPYIYFKQLFQNTI